MKLLFRLNGTYPDLGIAEAEALLCAYAESPKALDFGESFAIFDAERPDISSIAKRAAYSHAIYRFMGSAPLERIAGLAESVPSGLIEMPFCVRLHFYGEENRNKEMERKIASLIYNRIIESGKKPSVNLSSPRTTVFFLAEKGMVHAGIELAKIDKKQFSDFDPDKRPFVKPITMDSKTARFMVNLAAKRKGLLLDPFCGTGAILIEGGRCGFSLFGIEIKRYLAEGAKENLSHFGMDAKIKVGDARNISSLFPDAKFDCIVTDAPYGISASTGKEDRNKLYSEAVAAFERALSFGGRCVISFPCETNLKTNMKLIGIYRQKVSARLVRHMHVYEKGF